MSTATINSQNITVPQTATSAPIVDATTTEVLSSDATIATPVTIEQYVRKYYAKEPVLADVAKCESRFRQYTDTGDVIRGEVDHDDIGIMQINEVYNGALAKKLGYDVYTLDGNLAFAEWLYENQGTQPWAASQPCWDK